MKVVIISDIITGVKGSIIPYGLNIGKLTETEVDIIHTIDPRIYQGVYSSYSDSQSFSPGEKLSHEDILERETAKAHNLLNKLLIKEASRLNYPLKINTIIEISSLESTLKILLRENPDALVVTTLNTENQKITNLNELLSILGGRDKRFLILPPEQKFNDLKKVILLTDFSEDKTADMLNNVNWTKSFSPIITACTVVKNDQLAVKEMGIETWMKLINKKIPSSIIVKPKVLVGENCVDPFSSYLRDNEHDMIMMPKEVNQFYRKMIRLEDIASIMESFKKPIWFY
jgi:hypothetical protein